MALFKDTKKEEEGTYIALLSNDGENLVAFISPVKGVSKELLIEKLVKKGLNVELRTKNTEDLDFEI